MKSVP